MKHLDKVAHIFLYGGFALGILAIYFSRFSATRQFVIVLLLAAFYLIWAFAYHHLKKDAAWKLFLEYLIIALIAVTAGYLVFIS